MGDVALAAAVLKSAYLAGRLPCVSTDDAYTFGLLHDAEGEHNKDAALGYLGWFEDDIDDLARGLAAELRDIQAYRAT